MNNQKGINIIFSLIGGVFALVLGLYVLWVTDSFRTTVIGSIICIIAITLFGIAIKEADLII